MGCGDPDILGPISCIFILPKESLLHCLVCLIQILQTTIAVWTVEYVCSLLKGIEPKPDVNEIC